MSAEGNVGAATRVLDEGFNQGRLEVFDEVCSPDVVTHDPAEQEDVRGIEAQKNRCQMYRTAMPDLEVVVEDAFGSGDRVCTRWTARGTNDGELMNSWTVAGQDTSQPHGVQVAANDARGRLLLLDKTSGRIIRLDPRTGAQSLYSVQPAGDSVPTGAGLVHTKRCSTHSHGVTEWKNGAVARAVSEAKLLLVTPRAMRARTPSASAIPSRRAGAT